MVLTVHVPQLSLTFPFNTTLYSYHNPIYFPPNIKFHKPTFKSQSNLSTQNNPINKSFSTTQNASFNYRSDNDVVRYSFSLLRLFTSKNTSFRHCNQFHAHFVKMGVMNLDSFILNKLALMYSRSDKYLDEARRLFDEIPDRALPVYASLIVSYCRYKRWDELFKVYSLMINDGMLPDKYLVPTILKASAATDLLGFGKMVHGFAMKSDMLRDIFVGNALVDFYSNCGALSYSRSVFDAMQERDVVSWTSLVTAYMDNGYVNEAMNIFYLIEMNGVVPDLISWNAFLAGVARNGEMDLVLQVLEEMKFRGLELHVSSWNGVISGCVHSGFCENALDLFCKMMRSLDKPNAVTIVCILTACACVKNVAIGRAIHGYALKSMLLKNIHVEGSLINMFLKCGMIDEAKKVFAQAEKKSTALWNEMVSAYVSEGTIDTALGLVKLMVDGDSKPDEITYNTILSWYARHGKKNEAYQVLSEMTIMGIQPNIVSYNILISGFQQYGLTHEALNLFKDINSPNAVMISGSLAACADLSSLSRGKEIHNYVIKTGFMSNIFVSSALIDMYVKCSDMKSATEIFLNIEDKNTVSWNSIIAGHIKNEDPGEGFRLFNEMLLEGFIPSLITFMILLPVCCDMKALNLGRALHGCIWKRSWDIELDTPLMSALIDMYSKCGCREVAKLVGD